MSTRSSADFLRASLALAAAGVAVFIGCSAEIVDRSGSGAAVGSGGAGGVDAASSGSGGRGGGGAGGASGLCAAGDPPSTEPLCGPPERPCTLLINETLPGALEFRNDAPSLMLSAACAPTVLFSVANSGYFGFTGYRTAPGAWSVYPTPFDFAMGALLRSPFGEELALPNDGAYGASLWGFTADGWKLVEQAPGELTHWGNGVAQAASGAIYAGFVSSAGDLVLGTYNGGWSTKTIGKATSRATVAVSPAGQPHVVAWSPSGPDWAFFWYPPGSPPEIALPMPGGALVTEIQVHSLFVTAPDPGNPLGRPHVLVPKVTPGGGTSLFYLTREGPGAWTATPIDSGPGDLFVPLGIVAGPDGAVRLLYARSSYGVDGQGDILIAWPTPGASEPITKAVVASAVTVTGGSVALDAQAHIHLAVYTRIKSASFDVRYLVMGP